MLDLTHLIKSATQFVNTHPSHPRFEASQQPQLDTSRSDHLMDLSHQHAERAANVPDQHTIRRPSDSEIAVALLPALLGQNPKYLGSLISAYNHGLGEDLAHDHANQKEQRTAMMNLAHHYSDSAKSAHSDELAKFSESGRNYRSGMANQRMEDVSANNAKRIAKGSAGGRLTPEQSDALHQFNVNMQGIAEGAAGWTGEHQTAYLRALDHVRNLDIFKDDPHVIDSLVKSYPVGYKSTQAVALAHDSYHRFLSSIYHPGVVNENDVRRSHGWLIKNVPESSRWQFVIPQEGESWQTASQRLHHAEARRSQKAAGSAGSTGKQGYGYEQSGTPRGTGKVNPLSPQFNGNDWTSSGPIGTVKKGTLPPAKARGY